MRWHDVLTGKGFKKWVASITSGANVPAGAPLDPFTTSNRRLVRVSDWLKNIRANGTVGATSNRTESQAIIDLGRAKLVDRQGEAASLTELGIRVLGSWEELGISDDGEDHEIARSLVLAHHALQSNEEYYMEIMHFWQDIREVYNVATLFDAPESMAMVGYLNQLAEDFNPWDVIRAARVGLEADLANDWQDLLAELPGVDAQLTESVNMLRDRILGWAGRSQGRVDFCMALELLSNAVTEADAILDDWGVEDGVKGSCINVIKYLHSESLTEPELLKIQQLVLDRYNVILYGPPGTGKTRAAFKVAESWRGQYGLDSVFFVTFHPSYGYEDFVQGYRPHPEDPGRFSLEDGVLLRAARMAQDALAENSDDPKKFLLVVDEINRGDTARIFGELITYIEPDKRGVSFELAQIEKGARVIPKNLYFLGTMNTADKSISLLDVALRRRFASVGIPPKPETFAANGDWKAEVEGIELSLLLIELNDRLLKQGVEPDRALGHALLKIEDSHPAPLRALREHLEFDIYPLVCEYCYMNRSAILDILGGLITDSGAWADLDDNQFVSAIKALIVNETTDLEANAVGDED